MKAGPAMQLWRVWRLLNKHLILCLNMFEHWHILAHWCSRVLLELAPWQKMHGTAWNLVTSFVGTSLPTWNATPKKVQGHHIGMIDCLEYFGMVNSLAIFWNDCLVCWYASVSYQVWSRRTVPEPQPLLESWLHGCSNPYRGWRMGCAALRKSGWLALWTMWAPGSSQLPRSSSHWRVWHNLRTHILARSLGSSSCRTGQVTFARLLRWSILVILFE